jgi:hypothetical protein
MVKIGKCCVLEVMRLTEPGAYLDGGPYGDILLPGRYVPENCKVEDEIEVFISFDSEDRLVATTDKPTVMVDEFGFLEVAEVNRFGAFLEWGLPKQLFVPFREQVVRMKEGLSYLVFVYVDRKTGRIAATSKIRKHLNNTELELSEGDEVDLIIADSTDLGYHAIVNQKHLGILYHNELFQPVKTGDQVKGYIKKLREDGKIDLSLEKQGYKKVDPVAAKILEQLKAADGELLLSDKSDPETIKSTLGISKKTFKKAIGALYKEKKISISDDRIRLL